MPVAAPPVKETYRPLSLLAVLALAFGLVSPLLFVIDAYWYCFLVPVPGIFLSLLARREVLRSEGTVAGYVPATLAAVLTVGAGVGWITKALVVQAIVDYESRRFLDAWFKKLAAGQIGAAFLDTQKPDQRRVNFDVEDQRYLRLHFPGRKEESLNAFDNYLHNQLINLMHRYGERVQLRYLGRQEHGMVAGEQRFVNHAYELTAPAGRYLAVVRVESDYETIATGRRRGWYVRMLGRELRGTLELTPYGRGFLDAATSAEHALKGWLSAIAAGERERFLAECAPAGQKDAATIYDILRRGLEAKDAIGIGVSSPVLVIRDEALGTSGWRLRLATIFEAAVVEVYALVDMEIQNLTAESKVWRVVGCKFVGEQKRQASSGTRELTVPERGAVPDR